MAKKFQPYISPKNSIKEKDVPGSIMEIASFWSLEALESFEKSNPENRIFYILENGDTPSKLKPIRNKNKEFLVFFVLDKS